MQHWVKTQRTTGLQTRCCESGLADNSQGFLAKQPGDNGQQLCFVGQLWLGGWYFTSLSPNMHSADGEGVARAMRMPHPLSLRGAQMTVYGTAGTTLVGTRSSISQLGTFPIQVPLRIMEKTFGQHSQWIHGGMRVME